jgi:PilZ domain
VNPSGVAQLTGRRLHFFLQKPLTNDILGRVLRASHSAIALDRRRTARYEVSVHALSFSVSIKNETRTLKPALIVNVSRTGLCLETEDLLPLGATVRLGLPGSDGETIRLDGRVVWANDRKAGVQLLRLESAVEQRFSLWLDSLETRSAA